MDEPHSNPLRISAGPRCHLFIAPALRIDGGGLWVRDGAVFKNLDLTTGYRPDPAVLRRAFLRPVWLKVAVYLIGGGLVGLALFAGVPPLWALLPSLLLKGCIRRKKPCIIAFLEPRERAIARRDSGLLWLCILGIFTIWSIYSAIANLPIAPANPLLQMLGMAASIALVRLAMMNRGPRAVEWRHGWVRLGGLAPAALVYLDSLPVPPPPPHDAGARVYSLDLLKVPIRIWCRHLGWEALPVLSICLSKLLRAPIQPTIGMLRMEWRAAVAGEVSAGFRSRIATLEADLLGSGWSFDAWEIRDEPTPYAKRTESAFSSITKNGSA